MKARFAVAWMMVASVACASATSSGGGTRRNSDVITLEEIDASDALTVFDLIQQVRPRFLRPAGIGDPVIVYVDGVRRGNALELRSVPRVNASEIRYVSGTDATTRYGTGHRSGAIEVSLRR